MHERLLRRVGRIGNLVEDVYQGACVPVHCVTCTAWFSCICTLKSLAVLLGPYEMTIWLEVLDTWIEGTRALAVVFTASLQCVESVATRLADLALCGICCQLVP